MISELGEALDTCAYSLPQPAREDLLLRGLNELTARHHASCPPYARILDGAWSGSAPARQLADVPFLPVSVFKSQRLQSVPDGQVRVELTSSGTTGQKPSRIVLDTETSTIQQRALANSMTHVLGRQRLPMLVIDSSGVLDDPAMMSARGAGVLGMMRYGRHHTFALDRAMEPDLDAVRTFLAAHAGQPVLIFGFTFLVWTGFYEQLRDAGLDFSQAVLVHSGGWKKMADRSVDNATFRAALGEAFGLRHIHNFYGMVEQIGSVFLEGPGGLLYPPNFADVIVRDPLTWEVSPVGRPGIIEVFSLLPHSYPGHSLITEDLGVVEVVDPGVDGWMGKGIRVLGRLPRAELRGCSDAIAAA